mgnify:CR=1 FL=1
MFEPYGTNTCRRGFGSKYLNRFYQGGKAWWNLSFQLDSVFDYVDLYKVKRRILVHKLKAFCVNVRLLMYHIDLDFVNEKPQFY